MKTIYQIFVLVVCLLICSSCKQNNELIYSVLEFNVPISCISSSVQENDSIFYIGLENGNIIRKNIIDNSQKTISNAGNNRVYDIFEEGDTLWVGIRDEGLKKLVYDKYIGEYILSDTIFHICKVDSDHEKTTNYSPYDIEKDILTGELYFATSSGVYKLKSDNRRTDILTLFYRPDALDSPHFGVNKLFIRNDSVYCATTFGLTVQNKYKKYPEQSPKPFPKTEEIFHFFCREKDSVLYASSNTGYYGININNGNKSPQFQEENLFAYIIDTDACEWILTANNMRYKSKNGGVIDFDLGTRLSRSYKNYIHSGNDFVLLACENRLYLFSLHQNPKGEANNIIAAASYDSNDICYFITNANQLYSYLPNENTNNKVSPRGKVNIDEEEKPIQMCVSPKNLWLITDNTLYRINKRNGKTRVIKRKDKNSKTNIDFRSIFYNKTSSDLFIGSRYYLYRIKNPDNNNVIDTVKAEKGIKENDLYITDAYEHENRDKTYFSSLNKGLFYINKGDYILRTIPNSDTIGNIRKIIDANYLYTSKGMYYKTDSDKIEFVTNSFQTKAISAIYKDIKDIYYTIGYSGIGSLNKTKEEQQRSEIILNKKLSNLDISFNHAAIAPLNKGGLLLGSPSGLYKYNENHHLILIEIPPKNYAYLYIGFTIIIASIIIILYFHYSKKQINNILEESRNEIAKYIKSTVVRKLELDKEQKELEKRCEKVGIRSICKLKNDVNTFKKGLKSKFIERNEIIVSIIDIINKKIEELNEKIHKNISAENIKRIWDDILSDKEKVENQDNEKHAIDNALDLLNRILDFEKEYFEKRINSPQIANFKIPETDITEPLKTKIAELTEAIKKKDSEYIQKLCDEILESNKNISKMLEKVGFDEKKKEKNRKKKHIAIMYYAEGFAPQHLYKAAKYLGEGYNEDDRITDKDDISKIRNKFGNDLEQLLKKEKELQQDPDICYLYHKVKVNKRNPSLDTDVQ